MDQKYKKMLAGMQEKEKLLLAKKSRRRKKAPKLKDGEVWYLYILRCANRSLYTGVTKDLARRLKMHNAGRASSYTRVHRPVEMIYQEFCGTRTQALVRECAVKAFSKKKKEELVKQEG